MTTTDSPLPDTAAEAADSQPATDGPMGLVAVPCSAFVLRQFPKPCKPRKRHHCIVCGTRIEIAEECCRWSGLEPGEGYATCHAHPECYATTEKWDAMDWECHSEEGPRETPRMYWPNA